MTHPPTQPFLTRTLQTWASIPKSSLFLVALVVFVTSYAGIEFTRQAGRVAIIWPADAFMLAILLRSPRHTWVPFLLAGYFGNVCADWLAADPFGVALLLSACNTLEIVVSVVLFARYVSLPPDLTRPSDLGKFVIICGGIGPLASAFMASILLSNLNGIDPLPVFQTWFAADALGVLTIAPLLLMLRTEEWLQIASRPNRPQTAMILLSVTLTSFLVFGQERLPLLFLVYPFLILAAFRLRFIGAAIAMAILAGVSIPLTLTGHGPFALMDGTPVTERVVLLQMFLAITVFTILPVASVLAGRRRLEREAFAARRAAERANTAKSAFLANMSHELRTPMTGIIGMCDLLLANNQTSEQKAITETLERSARSFLELLNDLLDLAKIEAGRMEFDTADFRFSQMMKDIQEFFAPAMAQKGLNFSVISTPGEYDVLNGDPKRVRQILFNLVGNALKFTDKGTVTVAHRQIKQTDGYIRCEVDVRDTGIGMSVEAQGRLFRPFEQEDSSTSRRFGGTGLGLNICKQLVEAMGGDIRVESEQGRGSLFTFSLPLLLGVPEKIEPRFVITPARIGDMLQGFKLSVLFAEDNATTQFLVKEVMTLWGHSTTLAENGLQALEMAQAAKFDIILMDMQMPVMDGAEAVRRIRAGNGPSAAAPIIALTADAIPENRKVYLASGCNAVVTKPIEWDVLAQEIKYLVEQPRLIVKPALAGRGHERENPEEASLPILDAQRIDALREGLGPALMHNLLTRCLASMDLYLSDIRQGATEGDHAKVRRAAHDLKSVCAQFGAVRASEIARTIELELPDIDSVISVFAELEGSVRQATAGIQELQREMAIQPGTVSAA